MYLRIALLRAFFWVFVPTALLTLPEQAGAQDSLMYSIDSSLTLTPSSAVDVNIAGKWRLSAFAGYHQLYEKGYLNDLYLTRGVHASLATDYFFGQHWGIGALVGYQGLRVDDSYGQSPSIPSNVFARILPLTALHTFMLTLGPAFSFNLGKRVSLNLNFRGGLFYQSVPFLSAYSLTDTDGDLLTGKLVGTTFMPTSQRAQLGANGFINLNYQFTKQLSVGLAASASLSSLKYAQLNTLNEFTQKHLELITYGAQVTASYQLSAFTPAPSSAGPPKAVEATSPEPVCYPPLLDPGQYNLFRTGGIDRPVFKWRSSAPIYTEGEQYTFRLYTLPGNKMLFEKVVKEQQLVWPSQLPLPDTTTFYFYTLYTSRISEFGHLCRSEPVAGTISFYKGQPSTQPLMTQPSTRSYGIKLYQLHTVVLPPTNSTRGSFVKRFLQKIGRLFGSRKRADSLTSAPVDSAQGGRQTLPTLIYEGPVQQSEFVWPIGVALPNQPTAYEYTINGLDNQEVVQRHYLIVEPDGCSVVIDEATKNSFLRYRDVKPDSVPSDPSAIPKEPR